MTARSIVQSQTKDSFIYNLTDERLVAAMGLDGVIVVDTPEVLLVVHKDSVRHLGDLLRIGDAGHDSCSRQGHPALGADSSPREQGARPGRRT